MKRLAVKFKNQFYFSMFIMLLLAACNSAEGNLTNTNSTTTTMPVQQDNNNLDTATFGAGCFWCVEAIFQNLKGVKSVASGYAGGAVKDPTYKEVCEGTTGHAEVIQLTYDPAEISYDELLEVFWQTHDPTTLNQQGADRGTQYRSVVFYHNEKQKALAEKYKNELNASGAFSKPVITEISPLNNYYKAENYHQDYYNQNKDQGYCTYVIQPKLDKFKKVFKDKLKE